MPQQKRAKPDREGETTIAVNVAPRQVVQVLAFAAATLAVAGVVSQYVAHYVHEGRAFGLIPQFHLDEEGNLPTLFSTLLLTACGLLLLALAAIKRQAGEMHTRMWRLLGAIFLYLAVDEATQLHEIGMRLLRLAYNPGGVLHFVWVLPAGIVVMVLAATSVPMFRRLGPRTRRWSLMAAAIYLSGALGMEMVSGYYLSDRAGPDFTYSILSAIEETLEMIGLIVFLRGLMIELVRYGGRLQVSLLNPEP